MDQYKVAWTKLADILAILDRAGCPALTPGMLLQLMTILLVSSIPERDH